MLRVDETVLESCHKRQQPTEPGNQVHAGHGLLRQLDGRYGANLAASQKVWPATIEFLRKRLE